MSTAACRYSRRVDPGEAVAGPFVIGLLGPWWVLPRRQLVRPLELETVVGHEVIPLRWGDMLVRYWQWIAGTLLFC